MTDLKIKKDKLPQFLDVLSKEYAVYGPKRNGDIVAFRMIDTAEELVLDGRNSVVSPSELFLPRTEVVYRFDGENPIDEPLPDEKRVIIGMRPCDGRGLTLLDKIFDSEQVKDPFYVTRRANTVVMALGCTLPSPACFCTAVGGDPFGEEGVDVLLGDSDDAWLVKATSQKGEDLLAKHKEFFSAATANEWNVLRTEAEKKLKADLKVDNAGPRLGELFEDDIWETVSRKCLGCGACSYLCPTCYCFDLTDRKTGKGSEKIRRWDCCMFPLFTRHASGHNPRSIGAARLRQRIMHKFSYFMETYGVSSCVGCGRCVRRCPVNLDIREALTEVLAAGVPAGE